MEENVREISDQGSSRRSFLVKTGALTAGMALAGGLVGTLAANQAEASMTVPIPYGKLDIEKVRKRGYDNYFKVNCSYAAAAALLETLREVSDDPSWDKIPEDMFKYGGGGINGWGTLCGALNGALFVVSLATAKYDAVGNELIKWYTKQPFPSSKLDVYSMSKNDSYSFKGQVTSICNSPLCHDSVSTWCSISGYGVNSAQKKSRCAKLTGDTAAKAAELLNKLLLEPKVPFKTAEKFSAATNFCMVCHNQGATNPGTQTIANYQLKNEQGKMDCGGCHSDEHTHSAIAAKDDCSVCHK